KCAKSFSGGAPSSATMTPRACSAVIGGAWSWRPLRMSRYSSGRTSAWYESSCIAFMTPPFSCPATSRMRCAFRRWVSARGPARGPHAGVQEERGVGAGADELAPEDVLRGVAHHVRQVAEGLDRLVGRDLSRLVVPGEHGRDDERGDDRAEEGADHHIGEDG